jgi:CheY-like chemotaxis protein
VNLQSHPGASVPPPTILCVDDEANGLYVRKMVLQAAGYSVLTADNGCSALDVFSSNPVDCVVLDYYMPGMDGGLVAERMRSLKPSVPIVLLSAYVSLPEMTLRMVDAYVTKGQPPAILLERLRQLLRHGGHHPSS